jgi:hypothetical protein
MTAMPTLRQKPIVRVWQQASLSKRFVYTAAVSVPEAMILILILNYTQGKIKKVLEQGS